MRNGGIGMDEMKLMIDEFLSGWRTFEEFEKSFNEFWLEHSQSVPPYAYDLLQRAHERLAWTSESPSDLERMDGWWDHSDYETWLRKRYRSLASVES